MGSKVGCCTRWRRVTMTHRLALALACCCLAALTPRQAQGHSVQRVLMHAQRSSQNENVVVGSEMTCRGFARAFGHVLDELHGGGFVDERGVPRNRTAVIAPYQVLPLGDGTWDLLVIEGFFYQIHSLIAAFRLSNQFAMVVFLNFDPVFPGALALSELDVDVILTNSKDSMEFLRANIATPVWPIQLAADVLQVETVSRASVGAELQPVPRWLPVKHNVVFIGGDATGTKRMLATMLREAIPFGLTIYGQLWQHNDEFRPYWGGILPASELEVVYQSSVVAIGATLDDQAAVGMINNRVYEVMAAGCVLISDHFSELEDTFGADILYAREVGDTTRHLTRLFSDAPMSSGRTVAAATHASRAFSSIVREHTYVHRVREILKIISPLQEALASRHVQGGVVRHLGILPPVHEFSPPPRPRPLSVVVLYERATGVSHPLYGLMFWRAVPILSLFVKVTAIDVSRPETALDALRCSGACTSQESVEHWYRGTHLVGHVDAKIPSRCPYYDVVLTIGAPGGTADRFVRSAWGKPGSKLMRCTRRSMLLPFLDEIADLTSLQAVASVRAMNWYNTILVTDAAFTQVVSHRGRVLATGFSATLEEQEYCASVRSGLHLEHLPIRTLDNEIAPLLRKPVEYATMSDIEDLPAGHIDELFVGQIARDTRAGWLLRSRKDVVAFAPLQLPEQGSLSQWQMVMMRNRGAWQIDWNMTAGELPTLLCHCHSVYLPSPASLGHGGVVAQVARQLGVHVIHEPDGGHIAEVLQSTQPRSVDFFLERLFFALKYSVSMGDSTSKIAFAGPADGATVACNSGFELGVEVSDFELGRDGRFCVTAALQQEGVSVREVGTRCFLQPVFRVLLHIDAPGPRCSGTLVLSADLYGPIYSESWFAAEPRALRLSRSVTMPPVLSDNGEEVTRENYPMGWLAWEVKI